MREAWVRAERAAEVRGAARDWKKAGAIDEATLAAIEAEFPSSHVELARAWKVLIFVLVSVAVFGIQFAIFEFDTRGSGRFFLYAAILAAVTEVLRGSRLAGTGSDAATSFWAVVNLVIASGLLAWSEEVTVASAVATMGFAAACWRWGFSLYGAFAAAAGFVFLARSPYGRIGWAVVGALLCAVSARLANRPVFTPSRRRAFAAVFVVSALALYGAVNLYSHDERLVEKTGLFARPSSFAAPESGARPGFAVATALVPLLLIAWGLRARRRLILDTGALLAALSILTLHYYYRFDSIPITLFGLALIGLALWLNRLLARARGQELRRFTASPILSAESEGLAPAAALLAASASPASAPREDTPFSPGGGRYGGGGASGTFE